MPTSPDPPAASLAGALGAFPVPDILRLIAAGRHQGELLVVANGLDGRLWVRDEQLTGAAVRGTSSLAQAVFELALLEDGWFSFTAGRRAPEPSPAPQGVDDVLGIVLPQVVEWRDLLRRVPLDAVVAVVPSPPQAQVQLSAAQWQVLAAIGTRGTRVVDLVAATGRDQVDTVRTLRDMADAGLVTVTTSRPPDVTAIPSGPVGPGAVRSDGTATGAAGLPADRRSEPRPPDRALVPMAMGGDPGRSRTVASDPPLPRFSDAQARADHLPPGAPPGSVPTALAEPARGALPEPVPAAAVGHQDGA